MGNARRARCQPIGFLFLIVAIVPAMATAGREEMATPTTVAGPTQYRELQILTTYVEEPVEWKLGDWEWRELEIGDELPSAARIRVGEGGFAELVVGGRAQLLLTEETEVSIDALLAEAADVEVTLSSGGRGRGKGMTREVSSARSDDVPRSPSTHTGPMPTRPPYWGRLG